MFRGTRYLYELPWFVALGTHGASKTSALLQSDLQIELDGGANRHVGGPSATLQVDWWLSNGAVLIDTAGHYTYHGQSSRNIPARPAGNDDTQAQGNLRAVFFTSSLRHGERVVSEPLTIVQRLAAGLAVPLRQDGSGSESAHGYFLHDVFTKVILPEAHLVRPNLR